MHLNTQPFHTPLEEVEYILEADQDEEKKVLRVQDLFQMSIIQKISIGQNLTKIKKTDIYTQPCLAHPRQL